MNMSNKRKSEQTESMPEVKKSRWQKQRQRKADAKRLEEANCYKPVYKSNMIEQSIDKFLTVYYSKKHMKNAVVNYDEMMVRVRDIICDEHFRQFFDTKSFDEFVRNVRMIFDQVKSGFNLSDFIKVSMPIIQVALFFSNILVYTAFNMTKDKNDAAVAVADDDDVTLVDEDCYKELEDGEIPE